MPFERYEGRRGSSSTQRNYRQTQLLRKIRWPALATITSLAAFGLYQQSYFSRHLEASLKSQRIGWQSFLPAYISLSTSSEAQESDSALYNSSDVWPGNSNSNNWWDNDDLLDDDDEGLGGDTGYSETSSSSAAADVWDPFILNTRPITQITAKACMWPPSAWDICMPDSSPREDAEYGKWVRVEKDLNLRIGVYYLYLFYRRLPLYSNAPTVREFKLLTKSEEASSTSNLTVSNGWHKVSTSLRDGVWPIQEAIYLYYRTSPRGTGKRDDEVNEIDVVWGSSGTLFGWERMGKDFADPKQKKDSLKDTDEGAELMWRKGSPIAPKAKLPLTFSKDGKFRILQIADLHFSVGKGKCLQSNWEGCKDSKGSDLVTLDWLEQVIDEEKPDLIILTGDQLNGQDTSFSAESVILKVAKLFQQRTIPWAAVLGNHDSEKTTLTRYGQMIMMQALPYFVGEPGPIEVEGEGNYVLKLHSKDDSQTHLFTLYFLDSHDYAKSWNPLNHEYDYLKQSQIDWFKEQSTLIKKLERPFKLPTLANSTFGIENDMDYRRRSLVEKRRLDQKQAAVIPTNLKKPNAMAIFHMPLPEFYSEQPDLLTTGESMVYGVEQDGNGAPKHNSHFFEKAILSQTEIGGSDSIDVEAVDEDPEYSAAVLNANSEIKVTIHGHCHTTDQCRRIKGVWMCFPGGSSYSGYSIVGFDRRVRVYDISDYGETISTYKILDTHDNTTTTSNEVEATESMANTSGDIPAAEIQALEDEMAAGLKYLGEAAGLEQPTPARELDRKRQNKVGRKGNHKKVDEMILVGEGALQ